MNAYARFLILRQGGVALSRNQEKAGKGTEAQRGRGRNLVNSKLNIKNSITPGVTNFPISDLTWDQFIYPRGGKSEKTINAYVEALEIGAQFPPIKIQRVFNYADGNETTEATII